MSNKSKTSMKMSNIELSQSIKDYIMILIDNTKQISILTEKLENLDLL